MIKPGSNYLKSLPEQYFSVPKGQKVHPNVLDLALQRIEVMVNLLTIIPPDSDDDIAYILEGMIYQAQEMASNLEVSSD